MSEPSKAELLAQVADLERSRDELAAEVDSLRSRLDDEESSSRGSTIPGELQGLLSQFLGSIPAGIFVIDGEGRPYYANEKARQILGKDIDREVGPGQLADVYSAVLADSGEEYPAERMPIVRALGGDSSSADDMVIRRPDRAMPIYVSASPIRDEEGVVLFAVAAFFDVTERKAQEAELRAHREKLEALVEERTRALTSAQRILSRQAQEVLDVATPMLQLADGVLAAPLIGTLDSERTERFMERLLEAVTATGSRAVIVDITGVPTVDTMTAQSLIEAASAVRLLGAHVVLTGVRPAIAQSLVQLGVDLSMIVTRARLSDGIAAAEEILESART